MGIHRDDRLKVGALALLIVGLVLMLIPIIYALVAG